MTLSQKKNTHDYSSENIACSGSDDSYDLGHADDRSYSSSPGKFDQRGSRPSSSRCGDQGARDNIQQHFPSVFRSSYPPDRQMNLPLTKLIIIFYY